jgi:thiamine pyrophosphate-dependent acetolactate synthase large subunit-like protein
MMLDRRALVARLVRDRRDLVVVSGLGSATYDLAAAGDHARNFYLWGAMGGAALIGLGLALARPKLPVAAICGDGEMLMGIGGFATIALQKPANLTVVILDNGLYGETGGQPSHTAGAVDLAAVARGCGIADARIVADEDGLERLAARVNAVGEGPAVAVVKIGRGEEERVLPSRDGPWLKARLRAALSLPSM